MVGEEMGWSLIEDKLIMRWVLVYGYPGVPECRSKLLELARDIEKISRFKPIQQIIDRGNYLLEGFGWLRRHVGYSVLENPKKIEIGIQDRKRERWKRQHA
eukprot:TRINITY_DN9303_c0_g1_i1.p4 TRINITY_DN9303_c0_g1~~TRINITY_DN9303_c0_g1_i1.p4  ORF type:complete len:109 (-),score=5.43 TRINITY_DN9303_c0_g1_i1:129-431(-)